MIGEKVIYRSDDIMFCGTVTEIYENNFAKVSLADRYANVFIEVPVSTLKIVSLENK